MHRSLCPVDLRQHLSSAEWGLRGKAALRVRLAGDSAGVLSSLWYREAPRALGPLAPDLGEFLGCWGTLIYEALWKTSEEDLIPSPGQWQWREWLRKKPLSLLRLHQQSPDRWSSFNTDWPPGMDGGRSLWLGVGVISCHSNLSQCGAAG